MSVGRYNSIVVGRDYVFKLDPYIIAITHLSSSGEQALRVV